MSSRGSYCIEVYVPDLTVDQRNQLMMTICELLHRRELGTATGKSEIEVIVAARKAGKGEIEAVAHGAEAYRAIAFPKRDGKHEFMTRDREDA